MTVRSLQGVWLESRYVNGGLVWKVTVVSAAPVAFGESVLFTRVPPLFDFLFCWISLSLSLSLFYIKSLGLSHCLLEPVRPSGKALGW